MTDELEAAMLKVIKAQDALLAGKEKELRLLGEEIALLRQQLQLHVELD